MSEFNEILLSVSEHLEFIALIKDALRYFVMNGWLREECHENMYENLSLAILSITTFRIVFERIYKAEDFRKLEVGETLKYMFLSLYFIK